MYPWDLWRLIPPGSAGGWSHWGLLVAGPTRPLAAGPTRLPLGSQRLGRGWPWLGRPGLVREKSIRLVRDKITSSVSEQIASLVREKIEEKYDMWCVNFSVDSSVDFVWSQNFNS